MSRLKDQYNNEIAPKLMAELGYNNYLRVPSLEKVVVNMGVGRAVKDKKELDKSVVDLRLITGQQPVIRRSKRAISGFALRKGVPVGCSVTIRGDRAYEFIDKLFNIVLPRTRDFQGLDFSSFDGHGNYTLGVSEQMVFPEIDPNQTDRVRSLQITLVIRSKSDEESELLLRYLGCPLKKGEE